MNTLALQHKHHLSRLKKAVCSPWGLIIAIPALVALLDAKNLAGILENAGVSFIGTLPFIAIAVALIAYLKAAGAQSVIASAFSGRESRMIVLAALLGGLAPFCSCEVIPFIAAMLAVGTPISAVMAFWLSSPLIDPATLLITAQVLGWSFAVGKTMAAVGLGLFGGFAIMLAQRHKLLGNPLRVYQASGCGCGTSLETAKPTWRFWQEEPRIDNFKREFGTNAIFLVKWLLFAYVLQAVLITYIPSELIARSVGGEGVMPVVIAAALGMPAYLNGFVAAPLLSGLMDAGMSAGAAMAFMIAGPVSSVPAMAAVWSLVKPPLFAAYIGLGFVGAVISGLLFQLVI